jgi:1-acyl-sn-glycerol-3-phosphate acyltransferase
VSHAPARADLPRPIHPIRRAIRYWAARTVATLLTHAWLRATVEGRERLPDGPAIYAFNHLSWADPFVLMGTLPYRPRLSFFGPREEDMRVGGRNRLMQWTGTTIPYKPGKNDLLEATRRVGAVIGAGGVVAIAGEGRIGAIEHDVLPLNDGPAYFALRSRVPLVPIAINGTSWLRFGGRVRVRVGEPVTGEGRPDRAAVDAMTATLGARLRQLVAEAPEPDRIGRVAGWLTDRFNDWPEGSREAALAAQLARPDATRAG